MEPVPLVRIETETADAPHLPNPVSSRFLDDFLCQTNTGTILGTVRDSRGFLLPKAKITIENLGTGLT